MTPLLRRIAAENRGWLVPLGIAVLVNIGVYALVVRPLAVESAGAESRAEAAARSLQAAEREHAAASALVNGKARADEELNAFYGKVLPPTQSAANRMTYASLPALARRNNVRYEARTTSVDQSDEKSDLGHLRIKMDLHGDYRDIRTFIHQLETSPDFVIIDDIVLAQSSSSAALGLTVNLSTYFRPRPNGN